MISKDQLGETHRFDGAPVRIVSMVPSITELICDLGLTTSLVGCTSYCIHPPSLLGRIPSVGGTKKVRHDVIKELAPDVIIANKEENTQEDVQRLRAVSPVWVSDVSNYESACWMIRALGRLCDRVVVAERIITQNDKTLIHMNRATSRSVLYLIWRKPYMTIGGDTYINDVLRRCGYHNVCAEMERYPVVNEEMMVRLRPEEIFLSSEPFPFEEKHVRELQDICAGARVSLVDGAFFSWYGSRLSHVRAF